jgi:GTP-binding protein Era
VLRVAELIREKALQLTREEVPHSITVEVEELGRTRVSAVLLVETSSQKRIVVGTGGAVIREIGTRARPELEELLGRKLYLDLRVKVKERWRRDEGVLDRMGV